ncbi:MAG: fatty acid desaturase family protein [Myxococcales bacterium]|nr:fatty acid desaturase family protein [Myxococcales bacterium]
MQVDPSRYLDRSQLAELRKLSPLRGLGAIAWTWGWIAACFALYAAHPSALVVALVWPIMSGRHLALAILMHDGSHGAILRNKRANDFIGQWFTAYPTMTDMLLYRRVHFEHHRSTWTERDPDLGLAVALPVTGRSFLRKMIRDLTGQTAYKRHRALLKYAAGSAGAERVGFLGAVKNLVVNLRGFWMTNGLMLAGATLAGIPEAYLLVWWLPALTGFQVVLRIRSIAEHACVRDPGDPLLQTRTTLAPGWLRFLIAPHSVNYHLEHHLFMTVPHYNLKKAHRMLEAAGVLERAEVAPSYLHVLRKAVGKHAAVAA